MIQANRASVKEARLDRNWPQYLVLGLGLYLTWTLTKGVIELRSAYKRIEESRRVLEAETAKGEQLKKKWAQVQTPEYLEEIARNDLNMQKEGETVVVVQSLGDQKPEARSQNLEEKEIPNWEKWWNLVR